MTSRRLLSGHEVQKVSNETADDMDLALHNHGLVRIMPEGWLHSGVAPKLMDNIFTMDIKADDVYIAGFPKSGTTWLQEIVWTMIHNKNFDKLKAGTHLWMRSQTISLDTLFDLKSIDSAAVDPYYKAFDELCLGKRREDGVCLQLAEVTPSPRVLKNNFPLSLMAPNILERAKVIYIARNPKDVMVSFYEFFRMMNISLNKGNIEEYCKAFISDKAMQCPYWPHVREAWKKRHHPNMHFIFYENLKADVIQELIKLNDFLGTRLHMQTIKDIAYYTSFSAMKSRGEPANDEIKKETRKDDVMFYRKGIVGDWKNHFSPELQVTVDQWIQDNLNDSGMKKDWCLNSGIVTPHLK